ncbi:NCS2 family permease [Cysteiniphilum sp. QT6929]|uniref:NCS2 family permease n=1 Tax=Cysteiniphilum sp. QT6929 TaxID=2975055 RepID=UPI0024B38354|nr:NCS2 family permease [Cysteiniphilum sp. QT6929]WHN65688.1 NCS2 family permease [Cysteiniphilum sp. QT6929]
MKSQSVNVKTEFISAITTFLAMMYIIVVNPLILADAGIPYAAALTATITVSAIGCILMGVFANNPIAVAPGMGINAFFTYAIVVHMQISWQVALGVVFWSGVIFTILSILNLRTYIIRAIPQQIRYAVVSGIGLLIAVIALKSADVVMPSQTNMIQMAPLNLSYILFLLGLLVVGILLYHRVKGALIISILLTSTLYFMVTVFFPEVGDHIKWQGIFSMPDFSIFFQLDLISSLSIALWPAIFAFLFTTLFDSLSGLIGVCEAGQLLDKNGDPRNIKEALTVDAISGVLSGLFGTSSAVSYIESAAGIEEGAKTGLNAIFVGLLFLPFLFFAPLLSMVPKVATAPALMIVGVYMMKMVTKIQWTKIDEALPAILIILIIPLSSSITHGIILGIIMWLLMKFFTKQRDQIDITLTIIGVLSLLLLIIEAISI